jgi:cytoskeleton protein RodZ
MESIGSRLRRARESKGIPLEQAQKDTRIHKKLLAALEHDRPEEGISGVVYIKSFIRKYANYLGLDGAALAEEYKSVTAHRQESPREQLLMGAEKNAPFRLPVKKIITAGAVIIAIFACVKLSIFAAAKIKEGLKSKPKAVKKAASPGRKEKPAAKGAPKEVLKQSAISPAAAGVPKGENISLKIKAKSDVYIKIKSDGSVIYDAVLKKGSVETWEAEESLDISTSRAEAIDAELNGAALGALGKGVAKGVLITRDGLKLPK